MEQTVVSVEHKQFNMFNEYFNTYSTFVWSPSYRLTPIGGKWLQVRAIVDSSSDLPTVGQGSSKDSHPLYQPVPQQDIPGPKNDGSFRPVINSKLLNQFIAKAHFSTLQDVEPGMIRDLLREADWMAFIDLKEA